MGNGLENVLEKVLIVEDEVHARTGLTELIESWGYRAECAADGLEGLEKVVAWAPAIVVTDLKMPRMDGMELLSRMRELPQRVTVVMLTAQGSIDSAVEAMRMGANGIAGVLRDRGPAWPLPAESRARHSREGGL